MTDSYVAKANVVKVSIGPADGNRVARLIRAGGIIPEGVEQATLDALAQRGLIGLVKPVEDDSAAEKAEAATEAVAAAAAKEKADAATAKATADKAAAAKAAAK
ncbi:hypothetical protein [Arthrobacter sp. lap29]|uniref:hypothetical protein n=1 Tax=Arthrobacter sp. lap29 TaxID=3056122 RepID=UPI0028F6E411|nr:hypothetical protein [Arthrobacter sp. lap29]